MLPALLTIAATLAGPVAVACPEGDSTVRAAASVRARLADGPRDLWIAGVIEGDFEAARSIALHGCEDAVLRGTGRGTVLKIHADDVLVENIHFERSGTRVSAEDGALKVTGQRARVRQIAVRDALYGVAFEQCQRCELSDSHIAGRAAVLENQRGDGIKLWEAHGSSVLRNHVEGVRDVVVWYSREVTLDGNRIERGRYGTHFMYAHDATVRRSQLRDNIVGIFVMYSERVTAEDNVLAGARGPAGMGIGFKESDAVQLRGNAIIANTVGTYLDYTPRDPKKPVRFERNSFALNAVALRTHSSERGAHFVGNDFLDNDTLVEVDGNGDALGVEFRSNHWAAYAGYDLDGDGVGDVAFQVKRPASELRGTYPNLRFFQGTLAVALYDAVAFALPYFGTKVVLEDPQPAIHPYRELTR